MLESGLGKSIISPRTQRIAGTAPKIELLEFEMSATTTTEGGQQPMLASQRAKQTAVKPGYFPLSYKASARQWWTNITPRMAEYGVMSLIPYLQKPPSHTDTVSASVSTEQIESPTTAGTESVSETVRTSVNDPYGPRSWHSSMVQLSGKDRALNEFSVSRDGEEVQENLVMLHGYGAGLGFFYKNYEGLSRINGWKLYALDMLGMGRSSRPNFKIHAKDQQGKNAEAENWFIDALEEWRILRKIDKFTLLGHSMGGYMAVAYALKYPGHLKKLILASPVGIPEDPYAVQAEMPEPGDSTMANEFTQDQESAIVSQNGSNRSSTSVNANSGDKNNFLNAAEKKSTNAPPRRLPKWLAYAWDANISPFSIVRWSGPLGPRFVSGWTSRRFSHLSTEEADTLHNYSVSLFKQKGSGEYALAYILAPGAFARSPLIRRIGGVGRQNIPSPAQQAQTTETLSPEPTKETGFPIVFMYGDSDWMDKDGGRAAANVVEEVTEKTLKDANEEERKRDNGKAKVIIIPNAGHHVYLDGWKEFNKVMRREMEETSKDTKKLQRLL